MNRVANKQQRIHAQNPLSRTRVGKYFLRCTALEGRVCQLEEKIVYTFDAARVGCNMCLPVDLAMQQLTTGTNHHKNKKYKIAIHI